MPAHEYPYQNLSLTNIKGEKWKDIPGLEGYFMVSNFGRIKHLEYEQKYNDGRVYIRATKIIKPIAAVIHNNFMNDDIFFLRNTVTLHKQKHNYSIARLVYNCFIKPFNMEDETIVIITKDSNGLNIKPSNLKKATRSEKQKRIFELKRRVPPVLEGKARLRAIANARLTNNKEVTQYTMEGEKIKTYPSISIAAQKTGINRGHISNRACGTEYSAGGFIWRHGNAEKFDITPMLISIEKKVQRNKDNFGKKVTQYQMNGKRVSVFPTINDASKATGITTSQISNVVSKRRKSAGGFYWEQGFGPATIDLSLHEYGEVLRAKRMQKPVKQYSKDGRYLQTFVSVKVAASAVGVSKSSLNGALNGKQKNSGGYKWEYA
jgi:NUMOD4 motif/NUMOD1 domain